MGQDGQSQARRPNRGYVKHGHWKGVLCSVDGCDSPVSARGLCVHHYNAARWAAGYGRNTPEQNRRAHLRYRYGIDPEDYAELLAKQGGVCRICGRGPTPENTNRKGVLFTDHDHVTGRVRGLLCNSCNLIVKDKNSIERLRKAIEYLEHHARRDSDNHA